MIMTPFFTIVNKCQILGILLKVLLLNWFIQDMLSFSHFFCIYIIVATVSLSAQFIQIM